MKQYLTDHGLSLREFARLIEVHDARTVQRYAAGERIPGRAVMAKIRAVTHGEVTADDFYAAPADPPDRSADDKVGATADLVTGNSPGSFPS